MIIKNRYSKDSILKCCCPSSIDSFTSLRTLISCGFEHDLRFLSKKNYTTLPYLRGLCKMMPLYARNDVTLCKTCHILWTHIAAQCFEKNMLTFVCWFYFQVLAVLYFLPWFQVTSWEGVQTMRKSANNAHLDDVHEVRLSRHGQWLLSFGNISKNVHKTKQKLNQKTTLWPYVQTTHGPPLPSFVLSFDKLGQKLQKAWREQNTNTHKEKLKTQKTLNGGPWVAGT